ncbi:MAG: hypothetical protein ABSB28_08560 [Candidatus Bathyarchaeia archaeon]
MKIRYLALVVLCLSFYISSITIMIPKCSAQQAFPTVTYDEYGWTSDMKRFSMTTQDVGLTFEITVYNNSTKPFDSASVSLYIYINVVNNVMVNNAPQSISIYNKIFTFDSTNELYLPPSESSVFFVKVKRSFSDTPLDIGSYTADLSYSNYQISYGGQGTPMGQYPFNFQVETPQVLQQKIDQNPQPTSLGFLVLVFSIIVVLAIVLSVVITLLIATKTKFLNKTKRKVEFFGSLATILTVVFAGISLYLQIIRW